MRILSKPLKYLLFEKFLISSRNNSLILSANFLGANLSFGFNGGFASCLTKYHERIMELLADATMNSLLTKEEFEKERDLLLEGLKTRVLYAT